MVTAIRRGPRAKARRQRAASHIRAVESGPPETARTIAGAAFQAPNNCFASLAEIGVWFSSSRMILLQDRQRRRVKPEPISKGSCLALDPLLLAIDRGFDTARSARIFPRHLAKSGASGFLFFQRGQ